MLLRRVAVHDRYVLRVLVETIKAMVSEVGTSSQPAPNTQWFRLAVGGVISAALAISSAVGLLLLLGFGMTSVAYSMPFIVFCESFYTSSFPLHFLF